MKTRVRWMVGVGVVILAGIAVWTEAADKPRKDFIVMEIESLPGDEVKIHVTRPGQKPKILEMTLGVTGKEVRVVDQQQPGVTTRLTKDGDEGGAGGGKLVIAKWLDGAGTVPPRELREDAHR